MKRSRWVRWQPLLWPADFEPRPDHVGEALGLVGVDPKAHWALVMKQFARVATHAYLRAQEGAEPMER